nr:MAG TPA: hypothetical protein [Caudoviricetes sp.]
MALLTKIQQLFINIMVKIVINCNSRFWFS